MPRLNPGPFEPFVYLIQTRGAFRLVGIGGFALFGALALREAAAHSALALLVGLVLFAAMWLDSAMVACRRCRHYGSWHCLGQGMLVSRLFARRVPGVSDGRVALHFALLGVVLVYGLFWLWHSLALGIIFTLWLPLGALSAIAPGGFSWRQRAPISKAA
ncbi:MAG TPA: hypothetical protein VFB33_16970 [Candidatus Binataceae bacterium]|jgi:hypothetical protein|nr:hypothetical protein [Candidatus Binataceae bacterium]